MDYTSPIQEYVQHMRRNGPTLLGTTDDDDDELQQPRLDCGIREKDMRYSTTSFGRTWLPPHVQPTEHKVVLTVSNLDAYLNETELQLLGELVGSNRLNGTSLKMGANQFGSRMENKRHLQSQLTRLLEAARRLAAQVQEQEQCA